MSKEKTFRDGIAIGGIIVICILVIGGLIYGGHRLQRSMNWSWGYEDMVEEKIREMVKEESLK